MGDDRAEAQLRLLENGTLAAQWLKDELNDRPPSIGAFVPSSFDSFARVMNPILLPPAFEHTRIRWTDFADFIGVHMSPFTSWAELEASVSPQSPYANSAPESGTMDKETSIALANVLESFTEDPENCYFAAWEGYAGLEVPKRTKGVVLAPNETFYVFSGPLSASSQSLEAGPPLRRALRWWPNDHSWCIGSNLYSYSVVVAGTESAIAAVLKDPRLESFVISVDDAIRL